MKKKIELKHGNKNKMKFENKNFNENENENEAKPEDDNDIYNEFENETDGGTGDEKPSNNKGGLARCWEKYLRDPETEALKRCLELLLMKENEVKKKTPDERR